MSNQTSSPPFTGLDVRSQCRNWYTETTTGSVLRMFCRAWPEWAIAHGINHLLGQHPRHIFSQVQTATTAYTSGTSSNPLYRWKYADTVFNGMDRVVRFIALPRTSGNATCYMGESDEDGNEYSVSSLYPTNVASASWPSDLFYGEFTESARPQSGAAPGDPAVRNAEVIDGLRVYNGFSLVDVSVEDKALDVLHDGLAPGDLNHAHTDPDVAKQRNFVCSDMAEDIRDGMHEARRCNLGMALNWCATCSGGTWATPATTNQTGIVINAGVVGDGNFVNVFDQSLTTRDENSIGISTHAYRCGIGDLTQTNGLKVTVVCEILAKIEAGVTEAKVKFIGPDHIVGNETEISVISTTPAWVGSVANVVYLNPTVGDDETGTGRNKIDIMGKCTAGGGKSKLFIYGIRGYLIYPADLW